MARVSRRTTAAVEQLYRQYIGVRIIVWALLLVFSWMSFFEMGKNAIIHAEDVVRQSAVYERMQTITDREQKDIEKVQVYFSDGAMAETEIRADALSHSLSALDAGTVLNISLDASRKRLLGIRHEGSVLLDEPDTIGRMNLIAKLWMALGAFTFLSLPTMIAPDVRKRLKKKKRH